MTDNQDHTQHDLNFPGEFIFGVATAAYQIEGAVLEDGRGTSIWDTFSHTPGKVRNGDTGDVACDHYHRWESDLDLIASMEVDAYRFSTAWTRLFPDGGRKLNQRGLGFYDRLIDGCLERSIKPFLTLYHWDLPQALADQGGWKNRRTADAFAHYAATVTEHFGDRLSAISTFNEPWCSSILSHLYGVHAPGERNLDATLAVLHGQHVAHGMAVQAMRATQSSLPLGIVLNLQSLYAASGSAEDQAACRRHDTFHNGMFLDPLFNGNYPADAMDHLGQRMPVGWQDELDTIRQPLDYWGLNYYTPFHITDAVSADAEYPATMHAERSSVTRTDIGWEVDGRSFHDLLVDIHSRYSLPPCYITENGAAYNHEPEKGRIADQPRIEYLQQHLSALLDAMDKGIDVRGYFAWSLMDNFEWAEGYDMRFGLVHVDYQTQKRTLKDSAHWYQALINRKR